jgi:hypothetical protein
MKKEEGRRGREGVRIVTAALIADRIADEGANKRC